MSLHDLFIAPFAYDFMRRGLLSAMILSASGGLLGCVLVLRRLALMGDALSHSLLPGIALAWLLFGQSVPALFFGALAAGLLTALGSALLSRLTRVKEDSAFGALFIVFFAAGIALVSKLPTRVNLAHVLFGSVLGVSSSDLKLASAVSIGTLAVFAVFYRPILLETFDPIFHRAAGGFGKLVHFGILALTVLNLVAALQSMGIVLSLGLFLLPAVSAYLWCDHFRRMLLLSVGFGIAGSLGGILLSFHAGLASGASIVLCLGAIFLFSALFSPRHGATGRLIRKFQAIPLIAVLLASTVHGTTPARLRIASLHTVLTEIAICVGGDEVTVTGILQPGIDPHTFEPSAQDMRSVADSDLVLASGLHLESYLDLIVLKGRGPGAVLAVGDALPAGSKLTMGVHEEPDPHWWNSVDNVMLATAIVRDRLCLLRPSERAAFSRNAAAYQKELMGLKVWAASEMAQLPKGRRDLVTSHDAFGYFARDYGFSVHPLGGLSTEGEPDAATLASIVDLIRARHIKAVFAESSVNPRLVETLVAETGVRLGGILWADGLGPAGSDASTYDAMVRHNLGTLVAALR